MSVLWMTSLRPIGKSSENDKIQDLFIKSVQNIEKPIKFSLTQFDDDNVEEYLIKNKINCYSKRFSTFSTRLHGDFSQIFLYQITVN